MVRNGYDNATTAHNGVNTDASHNPTYALEHLATFKLKNESEIKNPKEKLNLLYELDKSGGVWAQKMFMSFNGPWLVMLDNNLQEIENFPGSLVKEPTAFVSTDSMEIFNNILVFSVPGVSLGNTEMHFFQVSDVSAVHMVEDLKQLANGKIVTVDRNNSPINLPKPERVQQNGKDQYGIAVAAAGVAAEKNAHEREQTERNILLLNHCFEDIERFIARLQYAAEAMKELEFRHNEHNPHGEGLLILRSRPPIETEFQDILAKIKLALIYIVKLQNHFSNAIEPINNVFVSLHTIVNIVNEDHVGANIPENVVNPLLRRETVTYLNSNLSSKDNQFWQSLGPNWTLPKDQFKDHKSSFHPIFYDDWSPDWVVDEEVPYLPQVIKNNVGSPRLTQNTTWLTRLQSRNVKIAEVMYNKTANTDKELNVTRGEYLEIIDDSRNWWKARNSSGNIGYVPHTILSPHNFEANSARDTDSIASSGLEQDGQSSTSNNNSFIYHNTLPPERESIPQQPPQPAPKVNNMPRSYSMPNVPEPPPLPPTTPDSPTNTMKRNMAAAGTMAAMRARNDVDVDPVFMLQSEINDELRLALLQRERRKDLEILTTPNIYITQTSKPREVEEWLRGKGFSDIIVQKLSKLNGEELFALKPHIIESYFGQRESRRLISQIVLQKNICEYKTVRSTELNAKLAKARQKADQNTDDPNEVF